MFAHATIFDKQRDFIGFVLCCAVLCVQVHVHAHVSVPSEKCYVNAVEGGDGAFGV
jgi:hypothetical protein